MTLSDELGQILIESRSTAKYMFNEYYAEMYNVKSGNVKLARDESIEFLRILYEDEKTPRIFIDIHRDYLELSLRSDFGLYEDLEIKYIGGEEMLFQYSTIHDLYFFDEETLAICHQLSKLFYSRLDNGERY